MHVQLKIFIIMTARERFMQTGQNKIVGLMRIEPNCARRNGLIYIFSALLLVAVPFFHYDILKL